MPNKKIAQKKAHNSEKTVIQDKDETRGYGARIIAGIHHIRGRIDGIIDGIYASKVKQTAILWIILVAIVWAMYGYPQKKIDARESLPGSICIQDLKADLHLWISLWDSKEGQFSQLLGNIFVALVVAAILPVLSHVRKGEDGGGASEGGLGFPLSIILIYGFFGGMGLCTLIKPGIVGLQLAPIAVAFSALILHVQCPRRLEWLKIPKRFHKSFCIWLLITTLLVLSIHYFQWKRAYYQDLGRSSWRVLEASEAIQQSRFQNVTANTLLMGHYHLKKFENKKGNMSSVQRRFTFMLSRPPKKPSKEVETALEDLGLFVRESAR